MLDEELAFKLHAEEEEEERIAREKAQQKSIMSTYLKNMDGWKIKSLKKKYFAEIQELFVKATKKVNTFVDFRTELVKESSKKAEAEIIQEDDGDKVTIDTTPLSSKSLTIVDYKIYQEGKKSYFQNFKADAVVIAALDFALFNSAGA
nr:hypothetical protein [Tanacetum cinerariifolium]